MSKIPHHLGIIMDGNRRWAKTKGLPVFKGHIKGLETLKKIVNHCRNIGVKNLTVFAFSTENWQRPQREVGFLMNLCKKALSRDTKKLVENSIKVKIVGEKQKLPKGLVASFEEMEESTKNNRDMTLNIALSYGGRAEIASAVRNIIERKISPDKITEKTIAENLWTSDLDFLIRTGKEQRLSNFLIWQAAYAELYFSEKYWPDFNEEDLDRALEDFAARNRRHGK
ncbi:MAG: Ditrans,polycis-undecaprenyl-diphosphate synthase ((2E,6E)-farnesyl-diphosphate specific) [Parcubacteria group bacterium GW2011_GWF2_43_11]|nr:MAG: Ditrans,polycis-undecaprenyl-diphosphate synthase ((2E,6E)-farnesyl-diphosphate specific) [Parcubacteria group bacterium GW2011_GWF2_43_11]